MSNRKVTQVKVRLLLQFPAKIKAAAFYYFMIHLWQVIIWSAHIKGVIRSVIPSDTELISNCPISASRSFSLKKLPLSWRPPTALFSHLWCYWKQDIKNHEVLQPPREGLCTKGHPKLFSPKQQVQQLFSGNKSFRTSCLGMKSVLQILIFESIMTYKN